MTRMTDQNLVIDAETGEGTWEPVTPEQEADRTDRQAQAEQESQRTQNRDAIRNAVRDHLAELRTIRNSTGTLTTAQLSSAVRSLAKGQIHVIRLLIDQLDGTD